MTRYWPALLLLLPLAVAAQLLMAWERAFAPGPGHALPERS